MRWVSNFACHDLSIQLDMIFIKERWESCTHFKHQHPHRPPIHCLAISLGLNDLWCKVIGRSTQCPGHVLWNVLCKPKIRDLDMTHRIQQQVLGLEIAIDHSV